MYALRISPWSAVLGTPRMLYKPSVSTWEARNTQVTNKKKIHSRHHDDPPTRRRHVVHVTKVVKRRHKSPLLNKLRENSRGIAHSGHTERRSQSWQDCAQVPTTESGTAKPPEPRHENSPRRYRHNTTCTAAATIRRCLTAIAKVYAVPARSSSDSDATTTAHARRHDT